MCLTIYNPQITELQNQNKLKFRSPNFIFLNFKDIYFHCKVCSVRISWDLDKGALQILEKNYYIEILQREPTRAWTHTRAHAHTDSIQRDLDCRNPPCTVSYERIIH